jgi:alcohol dehydrogenase class IV
MTVTGSAKASVSVIKVLGEDLDIPRNLREIAVREDAIPRMPKLCFHAN